MNNATTKDATKKGNRALTIAIEEIGRAHV